LKHTSQPQSEITMDENNTTLPVDTIDNSLLSLRQGVSSDIRIKTFVRYYMESNLNLRPTYQRNEVINRTKASRVIESAILGIPLPPIYLFKDQNGLFEVIDGQQRLISFLGFLGILTIPTKLNKFLLTGLEILTNLNCKNTDSDEFKIFLNEKIRDYTLRSIVFEEEKGFLSELKYEIFERLNKDPYPIKANSFELWNCIYLSNYTRMIKQIARDDDFLQVLSRKSTPEKDLRMDNENDILRYLVLLKNYNDLKNRVDIPRELLLNEVKYHFEQKTSAEDCENIKREFLSVLKNIRIVFSDRITLGNMSNKSTRIKYPNLTVVDVLLLSFRNEQPKFLTKYRDELLESFKLFFEDDINRAFIQNAKRGNNKASSPLNDRLEFLKLQTSDLIKRKYGLDDSIRIKIRDLDLEHRLLLKQNNICPYCNNIIKPGDTIHIDHMQSIYNGGGNEEGNLAIMHSLCNLEKGKKNLRNWKDIIKSGESAVLEFKSSFRWDLKLCQINKGLEQVSIKVVLSFLNTEGGTLLIGVGDDGSILGIENDYRTFSGRQDKDGFLQNLTNAINTYIGRQFYDFIHVSFDVVDEKDICVIQVDRSYQPAYLKTEKGQEFYIRANNTTTPMNMQEGIEYIRAHFSDVS